LDVGDNSGVGDNAWLIFCGKTWTITSDNEKFSGSSGPQDNDK